MKYPAYLCLFFCAFLLSSCGGSNSNGEDNPIDTNDGAQPQNDPPATTEENELDDGQSPTTQESGLVAHFRMDGNASDISGNENNGFVSGAVATVDRLGNEDSALVFDGVNDFVEVPQSVSLSPIDAISIFAWVKPDEASGPIVNYCVDCWGVHLWKTTNELPEALFSRFTKRGSSRFTDAPDLQVAGVLPAGEWKHVGTTYDQSTGIAQLWSDGELLTSIDIGPIDLATDHPIRIGKREGDRRVFSGAIDEIRIYNVALNREQVIELFSSQ